VRHLKARSLFTVFLILGGLIFVSNFRTSDAQVSTNVSGILSSDTTWTKANSPYNLTGNILVNSGVTLTIEPGVTVNFNYYYILVNGTLRSRGNNANQILLNNGEIEFTQFSTDWNETTGMGNIIESAIVSSTLILNSSAKINNCTVSQGGCVIYKTQRAPVISNNTLQTEITIYPGGMPLISNNIVYGIALFMTNATISGNTILYYGISVSSNFIINNPDPGFWPNSTSLIERNLISGNSVGIEMDVSGSFTPGTLIIRNNTITNCNYGIWLRGIGSGPVPTILNNNIYNNTNYNLRLDISNDINAASNWWGTTNMSVISQTIWEFNDDFHLGRVAFSPFLTQLNPAALPPAPSEGPVIPEFSSLIMLTMLVTGSLEFVLFRRRSRQKA
jgi:hypothetical protein